MTFQIRTTLINEDTGDASYYYSANRYQTEALANYLASKESIEIGNYGCGHADVVLADNNVYIKPPKAEVVESNYYYGCPDHATFGDQWFFGDDFYS